MRYPALTYLSSMPEQIDALIHAKWVIPVMPDCRPLVNHSVAVKQGRIHGVIPTDECETRFNADRETRLLTHALIPGLINAHTHAAMTLFRGMANDLPLMEWLNDHIWPAEQRWADEEFVRLGTRLAMIEMLRSGTTCFNDMYFFPNVVADAAEALNIRTCVGLIVLDFPSAWAQDAEDYLRKGTRLHDELKEFELVTTAFAPHAPYTVSDGPLRKLRMLADEMELPIHMHVHETAFEMEEAVKRNGVRPLERLSRLDMLNHRLLAVHMTQLLPGEIDAIASAGIHVIHCPESNLKLASGLCPVAELIGAGINVALGTDGAASNNDLDMFGELRTAALLAKGVSGNPTSVPAHTALEMATINGARALGLEDVTGSITPGKAADLVAVDLGAPATTPVYDPVAQIVYAASRDQVTHVWVNGRSVVEDGHMSRIDENECLQEANRFSQRLASFDRERAPS
ncbi:MAG: 5-methylthioadenosine/S-adenosylhomocysteine deaminase [Gammaproteobacteria bacterium]|nr:5-methylthioadenosine/S-adenosylhomocysteine deaminase [Gammaproteobacteria bacterium]